MATIFILLATVGLLAGADCRSIVSTTESQAIPRVPEIVGTLENLDLSTVSTMLEYPANTTNLHDEAVHLEKLESFPWPRYIVNQSLNLEEILSDFAAKTGDIKDYEKKASEWLGLLKQWLQSLVKNSNMDKPKFNAINDTFFGDNRIIPIGEYNWLGDLLEFLDVQLIDEEFRNDEQMRNKYSDLLFSSSDLLGNFEMNNDAKSKVLFEQPKEVDNLLQLLQTGIDLSRKYVAKLCGKHHAVSSKEKPLAKTIMS